MSTTTNLGRVGLVLRGAYDASAAYSRMDVVSYQGSSYAALKATTGHDPTDTSYWQPMTDIREALEKTTQAVKDANTATNQANAAAQKANALAGRLDDLAEDVQRIDK